MTRMELGDKIARALQPKAWKEYDEGDGVCTNMAGWRVLESIDQAGRIMLLMAELGFPMPEDRGE